MSEDSQNKPAPPPQQARPVQRNPVQPPMGKVPLTREAEREAPGFADPERAVQNNRGGGK